MCRKNVLAIVVVAMFAVGIGQVQVAWGGITQLSDAMSDLMDHIDGTTPLTGPQIEARTATIEANKSYMDDNTTIMTEAFDLSSYYETIKGPLFINSKTRGGFARVSAVSDGFELERAIFAVQQAIIDVVYAPANCQIYQTFLDGKLFETSDFFPGACAVPANPEVSYNADINASNPEMWGKPVMFGPKSARRPTGVYLSPGSIGEVTVPSAMVNQGFEIQVGAHAVDKFLRYKSTLQRLDRVSKTFPITSEVTSIANPLGGGVYILVPYEASLGIQTVEIANVVQSPFFSATSTNQTTLQEWTDTERLHPGPWADFESDRFMMNVPTSWIYNYADPVSQMQDWDLAMDGFSELLGFVPPHNVRNLVVLYVQPDLSIEHGAYGTGYPQINNTYNPNSPTNGNSSHFWLTNVIGWSTEYHECGHSQLFSKFPGHTEATVNLPYVYIAAEKFGVPLVDAFTDSMILAYLENVDVDQAALTWFVTENFRNGNPMDITNTEYNEVRYQHRGYGMYVEIGTLFGWDVISDFYYQEHLDYIAGTPSDGLSDVDSRIFRLSKAAGVDLTPLIHCWGVHPVNLSALRAAIIAEGLPPSPEFHARLVHYKDIIPANNAEFWDHYLTIYPSQPTGGNPLYQYGWYNVWKYIYDTEEGTAAKNAMQDIIDLYYQSVRGNVGLKGVVMNGLPGNPVSTDGGAYSGFVYEGWSGTVTPTLAGYVFTPASITYTDVTNNQINQDYTARSAWGDTNLDGRIDLVDFAWLATKWLEVGCDAGNNFCSWADINQADGVGLDDLLILTEHWMEGASHLMARWRLDELAGRVVSDSVGGNDGRLSGNPMWRPSGGKIGGAMEFDGVDDYVEVAGYKGIIGPNPRTVTAWVRAESNGSTLSILRWGTLGISGGLWSNVIDANGKLRAAVWGGSVVGDTDIDDDTWHHVAIVLPDKENVKIEDIRLYVDGEQEDTTISNGAQTIDTAVGMDVLISLDGSDGLLDDVRIYDYAVPECLIAAMSSFSLIAHWPLDESSGTVASDSVGGNDGTLNGDPTWRPGDGKIGGALEFDGVGDYVEVAGYKGISGSNPRTVTAWVRAESNGSSLAIVRWGTLESNGGLWSNVINTDGKLRAAVVGGSVVGDTVINDDTWHHVAIVLPDKDDVKVEDILLYVDGEQEDATVSLGSQTIDTGVDMDVLISLDGSVGLLDDVRIYDYALSEEEIGELAGVSAFGPNPADGRSDVNTDIELSWSAGGYAVSHNIYFGTESPGVFQANQTETTFNPGLLDLETTYYWRIDEVQANGSVVEGDIWRFTTGYIVGQWELDESSGTVASDSAGGNDGTLKGDPTWRPGDGKIGGALEFDGVGDYVEVAGYKGISGPKARTVTAWVRAESNASSLSIVRWGTLAINGGLWSNVINTDGKLRAAVVGGSVVGDTDIDDDTWHHVAIVLPDKEDVKVEDILLYVDGGQEDTIISSGSQIIDTAVGMDVLISLDGSVGLLDDVRIYNYALSEEEIGALAGVL